MYVCRWFVGPESKENGDVLLSAVYASCNRDQTRLAAGLLWFLDATYKTAAKNYLQTLIMHTKVCTSQKL